MDSLDKRKKFICFFSGGKDCLVALSLMIEQGFEPIALVSYISETLYNSDLMNKMLLLTRQAESLKIPIELYYGDRKSISGIYKMIKISKKYSKNAQYIVSGVRLDSLGTYINQTIAEVLGMTLIQPLSNYDCDEIIKMIKKYNIEAIIDEIDENIENRWLGKEYNSDFQTYLRDKNLILIGDNGEFNTLVVNSNLFQSKLNYTVEPVNENAVNLKVE